VRETIATRRPGAQGEVGAPTARSSMRRMLALRALLLLVVLPLAGCALTGSEAAPSPPGADGAQSGADLDLELRALLLLLEDRGLFEPTVVAQSLASTEPGTRELLARALERIGDPRGRDVLLELLADRAPEVRAAAAAALGAFPSAVVEASLLTVAGGEDRAAGSAAVAALARLGVPLAAVLEGLRAVDGEEVWRRIVPALSRFSAEERFEAASLALAEAPADLRRLAGLALAWRPPDRAGGALRELLGDDDPFLRAAAAQALGEQGTAEDLPRLTELLGDPEARLDDAEGAPAAAALGAIRSLVERGLIAAPAELVPRLLERFEHPDASVRLSAIEASAAWLLDERLEQALDARFLDPGAPVGDRAAALSAMARGGAPRAGDRVADAATASQPLLRASAAGAAARLGLRAIVGRLAGDPEPAVRAAALAAGFDLQGEPAELALAARSDSSAAVRGALFELLRRRPVLGHADLTRAAGGDTLGRERAPATRLALVRALEARGRAERLERGAVLATLERVAAGDPERSVRAAARAALESLGGDVPAPTSLPGRQELAAYRALASRSAAPVGLRIVTERGRISLRTDCRQAPKSCVSLLQLASQGFYDGQTVGDLVAGRELVFGDPSGTGLGDAGYRSLPETAPFLPAEPGLLLLDCSLSAGCGSRLRLLLSPRPFLADEAVLVARVTDGLDVARRLGPGDRILEVEPDEGFRVMEPLAERAERAERSERAERAEREGGQGPGRSRP